MHVFPNDFNTYMTLPIKTDRNMKTIYRPLSISNVTVQVFESEILIVYFS